MPTHLPIDFTKSPLERLVDLANSAVDQHLMTTERTTLLNFHVFGGSDDPTVRNAEIIVDHDRIGDGLPAGAPLPDEAVSRKIMEFYRTEYTAEDEFNISVASLNSTAVFAALAATHGFAVITTNDLNAAFTPAAGRNVISFGQDSLLYGGSIVLNITVA